MTRQEALEFLRSQGFSDLSEADLERVIDQYTADTSTPDLGPDDPAVGVEISQALPNLVELGGSFGPLLNKMQQLKLDHPDKFTNQPGQVREFLQQQPEFIEAMEEIGRIRRQAYADMPAGEVLARGLKELPGRLPGAVIRGAQAFIPKFIGGPKAGGLYEFLGQAGKEFPGYVGFYFDGLIRKMYGDDISDQEWQEMARQYPLMTAKGEETVDFFAPGGWQEMVAERPDEALSLAAELGAPVLRGVGMGARSAAMPRLASAAEKVATGVDFADPYAVLPNVGAFLGEKFVRGDFTSPYADAYQPEVRPVLDKYREDFGGPTPISLETTAEPVIKREAADIKGIVNPDPRKRWERFSKGINKIVDRTIRQVDAVPGATARSGRIIAEGFEKLRKEFVSKTGGELNRVIGEIGEAPASYDKTIRKLDEIIAENERGPISENEGDLRKIKALREKLTDYETGGPVSPDVPPAGSGPATGQPYEFDSIRNTESAPDMGSQYGQDIEPSGVYITEGPARNITGMPNMVAGRVRFKNPLVLDFGDGYGQPGNWKNVLSQQFGGKTGTELSQAIAAAGHDGIITTRQFNNAVETSEIVDLRSFPATPQKPFDAWKMSEKREFLEAREPWQMTREQFRWWQQLSNKNQVRADRLSRALAADESNELPTAIRNYAQDFSYDSPDLVEQFINIEPDDTVRLYRAISADDPVDGIVPGDWVAIERWYAEDHGSGGYGDVGSKIVELDVEAADVTWAGTDANEWIYSPRDLRHESIGTHEAMVKQAMEEGQSVPDNVLAEYPRLQQNPSGEGDPLYIEAYKYPTADAFIQAPYKIETILSQKYSGVTVDISELNGTITLSRVIVPESQRGGGIGAALMGDLVDYADKTGQRIVLTPTGDFGGNVKRLKKFYKSFDFVENKGQNKDFTTRETFIRGQVSDDYNQRLGQLWEESRQPASPIAPPDVPPADTPSAPQVLTLADLDKERSSFRRQQNPKAVMASDAKDVIVPVNETWRMQIYDSMTDDLYDSAVAASPDEARALRIAKRDYNRGKRKFDSKWGQKIKELAANAEDGTGGYYTDLVDEYLLNPRQKGFLNEVDMPRILQTVGPEGQQAIRGELLLRIFENARPGKTPDADITPRLFARSLNSIDRPLLETILGDELVERLDDLNLMLDSSGGLRNTVSGSQTAYNLHAMDQVAQMGQALSQAAGTGLQVGGRVAAAGGLGAAANAGLLHMFGDLPGPEWVAGFVLGVAGQQAYDAYRQSKFARKWQLEGHQFPQYIQSSARVLRRLSPALGFLARESTKDERKQQEQRRAMDVIMGLPDTQKGQSALDELLMRYQFKN